MNEVYIVRQEGLDLRIHFTDHVFRAAHGSIDTGHDAFQEILAQQKYRELHQKEILAQQEYREEQRKESNLEKWLLIVNTFIAIAALLVSIFK